MSGWEPLVWHVLDILFEDWRTDFVFIETSTRKLLVVLAVRVWPKYGCLLR